MSLAEGLAMARASLELIAELSSEDPVKRQVAKAISMLDRMAKEEAGRKAAEAERKRLERAAKRLGVSADTPERPRTSTDVHGRPGTRGEGGRSVNGSTKELSPSRFHPSDPERESETRVVASADVRGHAPMPREQVVTLTMAITPELEAIASMQAVQDVAGAWAKFCGYYNGRTIDVAGRWQSWCVREAKDERVSRDRAARRGPMRAVVPVDDSGNRNPVTPAFEMTAHDEERIERARRNNERPAGEPVAMGGKR